LEKRPINGCLSVLCKFYQISDHRSACKKKTFNAKSLSGEQKVTYTQKLVITSIKLETKHVLPNINRTQAAEREKCRFLSTVTLTFDLHTHLNKGRNYKFKFTRLPWEFAANLFNGSGDISYTNNKVNHKPMAPKTEPNLCNSLHAEMCD